MDPTIDTGVREELTPNDIRAFGLECLGNAGVDLWIAQQEVLVRNKERLDGHFAFELLHHIEQLVAGRIEVDELAFAAEHRGC